MKLPVFNGSGEKIKEIGLELTEAASISENTVLQSLYILAANRRKYNALTRTRGDVSGGGKKPWRQKGTGRARQGSTRSPIWRGGGVVHGPTGTGRRLLLNKKMSRIAFLNLLADKINKGDVLVLQQDFTAPIKTKECSLLLSKLGISGQKVMIVTEDVNMVKSCRNIRGIRLASLRSFGIAQLSGADKIIFPEGSFAVLRERLGI